MVYSGVNLHVKAKNTGNAVLSRGGGSGEAGWAFNFPTRTQ